MNSCRLRFESSPPTHTFPNTRMDPMKTLAWTYERRTAQYSNPASRKRSRPGWRSSCPPGYEAQLRPRSGLALKHAITLPNAPATIDPGYRGEIKVILLNMGRQSYEIHAGDRIAQMVIARYEAIEWTEAELSDSTRGAGGFGSSGR